MTLTVILLGAAGLVVALVFVADAVRRAARAQTGTAQPKGNGAAPDEDPQDPAR
ncbi:MAG: hypothetical protein AB7O37_14100 [Vicinamibacteria bacterium]